MSAPAQQYVSADEYNQLKREYAKLEAEHTRLSRAARDLQRKSYGEGRDDARREQLRDGSCVERGDGLASLTIPDRGGAIQFHIVGPSGLRPLTGGQLNETPDYSLRIWGPPDESGSYGIHEQGGGNLPDFSMGFDLTPAGIVIHRTNIEGVRARWDRAEA